MTQPISHLTALSTPGLVIPEATRKKSAPPVDFVLLLYHCLLEASLVNSQNACIRAKELGNISVSQESLNRREAELKLADVPDIQQDHHTHKTHHVGPYAAKGVPRRTWWTQKTWVTYKGQTKVNAAQTQNQVVNKQRDYLTQKMAVLQQSAQAGETNVNTVNNEYMQLSQQMSGLLDMVDNLTNKACLRRGG